MKNIVGDHTHGIVQAPPTGIEIIKMDNLMAGEPGQCRSKRGFARAGAAVDKYRAGIGAGIGNGVQVVH